MITEKVYTLKLILSVIILKKEVFSEFIKSIKNGNIESGCRGVLSYIVQDILTKYGIN